MSRKRPNLAEFTTGSAVAEETSETREPMVSREDGKTKPVHKSVYIPVEVLDQLDLLAIQERPSPGVKKKFNTMVLEGLDLLLKQRGLPGVPTLTEDI